MATRPTGEHARIGVPGRFDPLLMAQLAFACQRHLREARGHHPAILACQAIQKTHKAQPSSSTPMTLGSQRPTTFEK